MLPMNHISCRLASSWGKFDGPVLQAQSWAVPARQHQYGWLMSIGLVETLQTKRLGDHRKTLNTSLRKDLYSLLPHSDLVIGSNCSECFYFGNKGGGDSFVLIAMDVP